MVGIHLDRGNGSHLIITSSYPKYIYYSPYVTAIFLPPLDEEELEDVSTTED
jgi:hypothetical protein